MAREHGSSSNRSSSKRRSPDGGADGGADMSDASGRYLSPARMREPATGSAMPEVGESPTRFTGTNGHAQAPSPAAPTQDMTLTELTHAYQHLAAQAGLDKQWAGRVESAITDHALWLDKHSRAGNAVHTSLQALDRAVANGATGGTTTTTTGAHGANDPQASTADTADAQLRAHVQAQDVAMCARLDAAEQALRGSITSIDTDLPVHVQQAVAVTQQAVNDLGEKVYSWTRPAA